VMEFGAEFYVLVAFIVFVCLLGYLGAHRFILSGLDARGQAIADELAQAAKLRAEATALLASFEQKTREAEAEAAQIVADARAQAERLAVEAAESMAEFVARRTKQAETKIAFAEHAKSASEQKYKEQAEQTQTFRPNDTILELLVFVARRNLVHGPEE